MVLLGGLGLLVFVHYFLNYHWLEAFTSIPLHYALHIIFSVGQISLIENNFNYKKYG